MHTFKEEEGTRKSDTYQTESVNMGRVPAFTKEQVAAAQYYASLTPPIDLDPRIGSLVRDLIGRVADKWTMLILDVLAEDSPLRFSRLGERVEGISQKMLTQTLRAMERDGLIVRTVYPVVPPKVEYKLTDLGITLGAAFCGVWVWAANNLDAVEKARNAFDDGATQ
ncbi:winged helix-turn-helix transcriptional regulator [Paraburkholderia silvatlantica]|nr:helix-turn-helix domain-containing protein [Paraburkholderia silvatlantica]